MNTLRSSIRESLNLAPTKTINVIANKLSKLNVRVVFAALGKGIAPLPMLNITATKDNFGAGVVSQLVVRIAQAAGVPETIGSYVAAAVAAARAKGSK